MSRVRVRVRVRGSEGGRHFTRRKGSVVCTLPAEGAAQLALARERKVL